MHTGSEIRAVFPGLKLSLRFQVTYIMPSINVAAGTVGLQFRNESRQGGVGDVSHRRRDRTREPAV